MTMKLKSYGMHSTPNNLPPPQFLVLKMILLTAARPGMVAGMLTDELHDPDGNIPSGICLQVG